MKDFNVFMQDASRVVPSQRQIEWFNTEMYAFVHFTVNQYTDLEWGLGNEPESIFNPVDLDCDQWVEAVKSAGCRAIVLTAKHHDGFCLWPTKTTEHCVRNSPFKGGKGDVVREVADACRRGGIKFGFYLSPWDRNQPCYGTDSYNDFYKAQLTELLTQYGEIFMVWLDGACGEGPNGRKQEYDFEGYFELVHKYQPGACIFYDKGPDVRWCGNEAGKARQAEWAVVPGELCSYAAKQTEGAVVPGGLEGIYNDRPDIGALSTILRSEGLAFCPAEVNMSIRPGWFYHKQEEPHSLERLFNTYLVSVGNNACFHLNVPPMPSGRFDERDVARLKELGDKIRCEFGNPVETEMEVQEDGTIVLRLPGKTKVKYVELAEDIRFGQQVETFSVGGWLERKQDVQLYYHGFTIGHKKICPVNFETDAVYVKVTAHRGEPRLMMPKVYGEAIETLKDDDKPWIRDSAQDTEKNR